MDLYLPDSGISAPIVGELEGEHMRVEEKK